MSINHNNFLHNNFLKQLNAKNFTLYGGRAFGRTFVRKQAEEFIKLYYTHDTLCRLAANYLKTHRDYNIPTCPFVAIELYTSGQETPDVFGFNYTHSVLIEVKTSRSDFLKDFKKTFRTNPEQGIGSHRYYFCLPGIIVKQDLPKDWGLIYYNPEYGNIDIRKLADPQPVNHEAERKIFYSIIRREIKPQILNYKTKKS